MICAKIASTVGLLFDVIGALMIAYEVFKKFDGDKFQPDAGIGLLPSGEMVSQSEVQPTPEYQKWEQRRVRMMKIGLAFLLVGFGLQIIGNWI